MTRIVVDPEHLQALASLLRRCATDVRATSDQLNAVLNGLSPEEAKQLNITAEWEQARLVARGLSDQAEGNASTLALKARNLQDADSDAAMQIGRAFADFHTLLSQAPSGWQPGAFAPPVPQDLISRLAGLGGSQSAVLPVASVAGLAAMVGVAAVTTRHLTHGSAGEGHKRNGSVQSLPAPPKGAEGAC
jgi:hypothetical protein